MVSDKQHCRATGNVTAMVRQPQEGRSRAGGLKLGEMEKDALIAHGTSAFLKERLFNMSDPYSVSICKTCKNFLTGARECLRCKNSDEICKINLPYACKLLIHQLNSMNIKTDIVTR
jgi:DNA-directed RNA polymerase beta subunit